MGHKFKTNIIYAFNHYHLNTVPGSYDYHESGPERRKYEEALNTEGKATHYEYRGRVLCDEHGSYEIETLMPSPYLDDEYEDPPGVWRCAHVHFFVCVSGYKPLVTQIYFKGHTITPGGYPDKHAEKSGDKLLVDLKEVNKKTAFGEQQHYMEAEFDIVLEDGSA